jgi:uncharacterized beta-barrel protein YwiB (DUF1934 family)
MNQKVLIKLENKQNFIDDIENEKIAKEYSGELYKKQKKYYLSYNENSEGIEGARTILKIDPTAQRVLLMRQKPAEMKQDFKIGKKIKGYFSTEYGNIKTAVKTNHLKIDIKEKSGKIHIKYQLYLGGELSSEHSLKLSYKNSN